MAAPHAAGVAALVWGANPDLTGPEVVRIIIDSAVESGLPVPETRSVSSAQYRTRIYHQINAHAAVAMALAIAEDAEPPVILPPEVAINWEQAFLDVLEANRQGILAYEQYLAQGGWRSTIQFHDNRNNVFVDQGWFPSVALLDINEDGIPELFFMTEGVDRFGTATVWLHVYQIKSSQAVRILHTQFNGNFGRRDNMSVLWIYRYTRLDGGAFFWSNMRGVNRFHEYTGQGFASAVEGQGGRLQDVRLFTNEPLSTDTSYVGVSLSEKIRILQER